MKDNDDKPGWQLFKLWGGDNRQYRLISHIITCITFVVIVALIFG